MSAPTESNINVDKPNFSSPVEAENGGVFNRAWQAWLAILHQALKVVDGGTP